MSDLGKHGVRVEPMARKRGPEVPRSIRYLSNAQTHQAPDPKRAGSARIDLLPLHEALVVMSVALDFAFFALFINMIALAIAHFNPEFMESSSAYLELTPFILLSSAPAQLFVTVAQVEAHRGRSAVAGLSRFRLEYARCYSDSDREGLQNLIAKWFTERTDGEDAAEDARRVGFHRFENFVAHTVAPSLLRSRSSFMKMTIIASILLGAGLFDTMCSEAFTTNHVIGLVAQLSTSGFIVYFKLFIFSRSASLVLVLRERYGWSTVPAYGVGVFINILSNVGMMASFFLVAPQMAVDPSYRLPDDGLDPTARKMVATQVATILTVVCAMAISATFEF